MKITNNIKVNIKKEASNGMFFNINIRLNDQCKNGHNDFSITGDYWHAGEARTERNACSGAIGDTIAKHFPEFQIFENLHLCDVKGAPMHASANGFYHLNTQEMEKTEFCKYYRVSPEQFDKLKTAEDEQHFKYLLYSTGVTEQWQDEATKAIALLEEMSGLKFEDDSVRFNLMPLKVDEAKEMQNRISTGYYSAEQKTLRAKKLRDEQKQTILDEVNKDFELATKKATAERDAKILVLESELPLNNFLFYNHSLTGSFNWKSYEKKVTQEQFNAFLEFVKDKTPEGVTWELK